MKPEEWDWSRTVVDHLDLHASDFRESVRFYETVLTPLEIPKLFEHDGEACFTHVNVVDRTPPTQNLHLCFYTRSRGAVDEFHRAGVAAGFRSNGEPGYRAYAPGYYAAYLLDPDGTTSRRSTATLATPATAADAITAAARQEPLSGTVPDKSGCRDNNGGQGQSLTSGVVDKRPMRTWLEGGSVASTDDDGYYDRHS